MNTLADVKAADTAALIKFYNEQTGKSIKKFESRAVAEERVAKLIKEKQPIENIKQPQAKPPASTKSKRTKRDDYLDQIITMNTTKNHKRPNTRAFDKFAILLNYNGKTIREYVNEQGKHPHLDIEPGWAFTEIRYARDYGFLKICKMEQKNVA